MLEKAVVMSLLESFPRRWLPKQISGVPRNFENLLKGFSF